MERTPGSSNASTASARMKSEVPVKKKIVKKRGNLPKQSVKILRNWLIARQKHAYPDEKEKLQLVQETELTLEQVSNWFINARRRILPEMLKRNGQNPENFRITRKKNKTPELVDSKTISDRDNNKDSDDLSSRVNPSLKRNSSNSNDVNQRSLKRPKTSKQSSDSSLCRKNVESNTDTTAGDCNGNSCDLSRLNSADNTSEQSSDSSLCTRNIERNTSITAGDCNGNSCELSHLNSPENLHQRALKNILKDKREHLSYLKVGEKEGIADISKLIYLAYVASAIHTCTT